ncbi:Pao retrotransposon peptidase [Popillia japonica]|uniref:Pao retrotransposon peptidase n=1 Tax=Popillia japonica TaxID=7064 RepID=A0AAW1JIE2_POPJA
MLQKLWMEKVAWDEVVPDSIAHTWEKLKKELVHLNSINIMRRVTCNDFTRIELHGFADASIELLGFADASESAYGACIYVRSIDCEGNVRVNLLCAKSKVAPVKSQTMPRLELCGALTLSRLLEKVLQAINIEFDHCYCALTLSRLLEKVLQAINIEFDHCYCWTDSRTIVLGWLKQLPNQCKTFIGNRVSEIQNVCGALTLSRLLEKRFKMLLQRASKSDWRHVPSKHNAADILSRGMYPNDLQECHMWWHGPTFLLEEPSRWPNTQFDIPGLPEMKEPTRALLSFEKSEKFPFDRFPTLTKLKRTVAFMLRFKTNCFKQKFKRNVDFHA